MQLFHLEGDDPYDKFLPKISSVIKKISIIYISLTFTLILFYYVFGMSFFDAITHSFTTISTGGFSNYDQSFAFFNDKILFISVIFMIVGSLPFMVIARTTFKNLFIIIKDHQVRLFLIILIVATTTIYILAKDFIEGSVFISKLINVSFNTISIISGTGYVSENFENWGNYASVLFLILMFIGGCAGSTTGGIKVFRFQILFKYINLHLKRMLKPHSVVVSQFNEKKVPDSTYESVMIFFFLFEFQSSLIHLVHF